MSAVLASFVKRIKEKKFMLRNLRAFSGPPGVLPWPLQSRSGSVLNCENAWAAARGAGNEATEKKRNGGGTSGEAL